MAIPINSKIKEGPKLPDTWILGSKYTANRRADIRRHTLSILRLTYRSNFPPLAPYHFTSDAGWGCMLRSAQMLMAQALQRHLLGREWRAPDDTELRRANKEYCDILRWFTDYPGPPSVYSIHHLVQCGMRYDKLPGEWYGPSTAAFVLRDLAMLHHRKYRGPVEVFACQGDTIYINEIEKFADNASDYLKDRDNAHASSASTAAGLASSSTPLSSSSYMEGEEERYERGIDIDIDRESCSGSQLFTGDGVESPPHTPNNEYENTKTNANTSSNSNNSAPDRLRTASDRSADSRNMNGNGNGNNVVDTERIAILTKQSSSTSTRRHRLSRSQLSEGIAGNGNGNGNGTSEDTHGHITFADVSAQDNDDDDDPSMLTANATAAPPPTTPTKDDDIFIKRMAATTTSDIKLPLRNLSVKIDPSERVHDPFYDPLLNPPPHVHTEKPWSCGLVLLIPLRLGINQELKEILESRYTLGILGGRPRHAIYFVGHRGDLLLGLDPHAVYTNPSLAAPFPATEYMSQVHVNEFQCLDLTMLDPSIALAFYFRCRAEFEAFCDNTRVSVEQKKQAGRRSLFNVQQCKPSYENTGDGDWGHSDGDASGDDDEYVFL
eukprot:gene3455-6876_t